VKTKTINEEYSRVYKSVAEAEQSYEDGRTTEDEFLASMFALNTELVLDIIAIEYLKKTGDCATI